MGLESFTYITSLNASNPVTGDNKTEGDDHIRGLKTALLNSFPAITGAVTPTHTQLNALIASPTMSGPITSGATNSIGGFQIARYTDGAVYWSIKPYDNTSGPDFSIYNFGLAATSLRINSSTHKASFTSVVEGNGGGGNGLGKITVSTSAPSGGAAGDIWIQY